MTQKKKLLDFLTNAPAFLKEKTASSFNQLKENTKTDTNPQIVTPAFANSSAFIEKTEPQQLEPLNIQNKTDSEGLRRDNNEQINLNSVVTERSQQEEPTNKPQRKSLKKSQLSQIEEEKQRLQQMLRKVNSEIKELKDDDNKKSNAPTNTFKRYKEISQDEKAYQNAQKLVVKLHQEKKAQQQKKQKEQRQKLEQLERQARLKEQERKEEMERQKEERRQIIAKRIAQEQRKREERRMIDQQSNELIKQIKKDEQRKPVSTSLEMRELENKKKLLEKKRNFDFGELQQHQKRYAEMKLRHAAHSSMEQQNHSLSVPRYPKGKFMEQIEHEERIKKDEEKLKEEERRNLVQKRLKYGQLVKKIFLPPKPIKKPDEEASRIKPPTPDVVVNGSIKQQIPRKTYTNSHDNINRIGRLPELSKATGSLSKASQFDPISQAERQQKQRIKREKLQRERQIRRQTKQRLRHAQEAENDRRRVELPKVKKYENYLDKLPKHKSNNGQQDWKKIIDNESMTKEEKYRELMSKANYMENKAKFKEQMATGQHGENQQAMNLIIGSIQAKLALLDKF